MRVLVQAPVPSKEHDFDGENVWCTFSIFSKSHPKMGGYLVGHHRCNVKMRLRTYDATNCEYKCIASNKKPISDRCAGIAKKKEAGKMTTSFDSDSVIPSGLY